METGRYFPGSTAVCYLGAFKGMQTGSFSGRFCKSYTRIMHSSSFEFGFQLRLKIGFFTSTYRRFARHPRKRLPTAHSPIQMPLSYPVAPPSQRELRKGGGCGGGGVARRARAARTRRPDPTPRPAPRPSRACRSRVAQGQTSRPQRQSARRTRKVDFWN